MAAAGFSSLRTAQHQEHSALVSRRTSKTFRPIKAQFFTSFVNVSLYYSIGFTVLIIHAEHRHQISSQTGNILPANLGNLF